MPDHHCLLDGPKLDLARAAGTEAAGRRPPGPDDGWSNWEANDYLRRTHADEREAFLAAYRAERARRKREADASP